MLRWTLAELAKYPHMQMIKDGKPFFLVTANPVFKNDEILLRDLSAKYSYRMMWDAFNKTSTSWSFMSWCADMDKFRASKATITCNQYFTKLNGKPEQLAIAPAYNAYLMSDPAQATSRFEGKTFIRQFETLTKNPTMAHATFDGWNQWTAIR